MFIKSEIFVKFLVFLLFLYLDFMKERCFDFVSYKFLNYFMINFENEN